MYEGILRLWICAVVTISEPYQRYSVILLKPLIFGLYRIDKSRLLGSQTRNSALWLKILDLTVAVTFIHCSSINNQLEYFSFLDLICLLSYISYFYLSTKFGYIYLTLLNN